MVRFVSTFKLKPGVDTREAEKLWHDVHVKNVQEWNKDGYRLKKYVISRIMSDVGSEPDLFGMVEMWFEDMENARACMKNFIGKPQDAFIACTTDARRVFTLTEEEIPLDLPEEHKLK